MKIMHARVSQVCFEGLSFPPRQEQFGSSSWLLRELDTALCLKLFSICKGNLQGFHRRPVAQFNQIIWVWRGLENHGPSCHLQHPQTHHFIRTNTVHFSATLLRLLLPEPLVLQVELPWHQLPGKWEMVFILFFNQRLGLSIKLSYIPSIWQQFLSYFTLFINIS